MADPDLLFEEIDADADARLTASGLDRTRRAVAALWAPDIRDGRPVPVSALSPALCDAMVALGYVTPAQLRAAGIPGYPAPRVLPGPIACGRQRPGSLGSAEKIKGMTDTGGMR